MSFGERFREERLRRGYSTATALAAHLGVAPAWLSGMEHVHRSSQTDVFADLHALGFDVCYILTGERGLRYPEGCETHKEGATKSQPTGELPPDGEEDFEYDPTHEAMLELARIAFAWDASQRQSDFTPVLHRALIVAAQRLIRVSRMEEDEVL